jgi:hypothetical protein
MNEQEKLARRLNNAHRWSSWGGFIIIGGIVVAAIGSLADNALFGVIGVFLVPVGVFAWLVGRFLA